MIIYFLPIILDIYINYLEINKKIYDESIHHVIMRPKKLAWSRFNNLFLNYAILKTLSIKKRIVFYYQKLQYFFISNLTC